MNNNFDVALWHELDLECQRARYQKTVVTYLETQIKRKDLPPHKKENLQKIYNFLLDESQDKTIEKLKECVDTIKTITSPHTGHFKKLKGLFFKPISYNAINKLFDDNSNLKSFNPK